MAEIASQEIGVPRKSSTKSDAGPKSGLATTEPRLLARRLIDLAHPVAFLENFARLGAVGRADDAVLLHEIDQARGTAIADAQAALQCGSRGAAHLANHADSVLI